MAVSAPLRTKLGCSGCAPAHLAPGHPAPQVTSLQRLADWSVKHVPRLDGRQPEGELVGEVVAGAARPVALDEGGRAEILEARARRGERLAPTFCSSCCVLEKDC